jgi:DNA-binding CsgD family transcriptional regulator
MDLALDRFSRYCACAAEALAKVSSEHFPERLVALIGTLVRVESIIISLECKGQPPVLLFDQGIPLAKREMAINHYFARGYLLDPFCSAVKDGLSEGFYHVAEVAPDNFMQSEYYASYYVDCGAVEDCYFNIDVNDLTKICICIYHDQPLYRFSIEELAALRAAEPLIRQLALAHWRGQDLQALVGAGNRNGLVRPLETVFMNFCRPILTEREIEITHLILRGHSSKSAAREMGISSGTVRVHRKNLYKKLQVNSQSELFSLFLASI